jgi:hypothetical protein
MLHHTTPDIKVIRVQGANQQNTVVYSTYSHPFRLYFDSNRCIISQKGRSRNSSWSSVQNYKFASKDFTKKLKRKIAEGGST